MLPILLSLVLLGSGASVAENPYDVEGGLSPSDIAGFAKKAGFPEKEIPEAVRIVLLESKGVPTALQEKADDPAVGLFQVDLKPHWDKKGEDNPMRKWFKQRGVNTREDAVEWLKDPLNNAEAAFKIWSDRKRSKNSPTGWEAWSAYNGGNKPVNREQKDWNMATNAMEAYMQSLQPKDEVKMEEETVEEVVEIPKVEEPTVEPQLMQQENFLRQRQQEAFRAKEIEQRTMTPRKQKINDVFVKLFSSLGRM
jgi:hypothetical protein